MLACEKNSVMILLCCYVYYVMLLCYVMLCYYDSMILFHFLLPGHTRLFSSLLKLEHGLISGQWDVVRIDLS